jgi:MFS family permease
LIRRYLNQIGGNRIVLALSIARLGDAIGNSILIIVLPLYVAKLPSPSFPLAESIRVGILISLYGLINTIFQPFMGAFSDRLNKRKPFIQGGLLLMALGTLGFVFSSRFTDLLLLRSLQGLGVGLTVPAAMALMALASERDTRGGAMGIYTTLRMLGLALGPLLGGVLLDRLGFNVTFYTGAAFIIFGMLLVQVWVEDKPVKASPRSSRRFRIIDRDLLSPGILGAGFATFVMAGAFTMMATLEEQFNTRLNMTAFGFSIAFSALMVTRLLFQVPLGRWSDRIGRKPLIITGLILMAPVTALLGETTSLFQLTGLRLVQGLASAGIAAPAFAVAADLAVSGGEGRQMSIITMGFGLGIALGPLAAGILAVYSFELPFIVGGILSLVGAWVVYRYVPETVAVHQDQNPYRIPQTKEKILMT